MSQFLRKKDNIPSEVYKFCGTLTVKQKRKIKSIPNKFVDIGRCDKCMVQLLMRAFGIDLEKTACGGREYFQKFFPKCPTYCDITQIVASEFISNINAPVRIAKI